MDKNVDITSFLLSENVLRKHANILDVCFQHSLRSCCFTKSYGKYIEGTGSVFTNSTEEEYHKTYESIQNLDPNSEEYLQQMLNLNLRFFTPKEISRLMCFPESFNFPNISNKQKYMLLGNSVNVKVVSELIKLLNK